ncbi:MAG: small multi-drug export protein [Candidatus Cloacimonadota bacterium]|nr:small multi-drug export protein [Candidatus Cloacimonadota bacterium]
MKKVIFFTILLIIFSSNIFASDGLKSSIKEKIDTIELSSEMKVFMISMLPIFELRGAIPIGINYYRLNPYITFLVAITGNMVPIFFILLMFRFVELIMRKWEITENLLEFVFTRTRKKSKIIEKYEELGLIMFVAIPLPITGAWTGSLAAYLFGLNFWKSISFIFIGVLAAGIVITLLSILGWIGAIIALAILTFLLVIKLASTMKNKQSNLEC